MVVKLQNGNFLYEKINHSVTSFQPTEPALSLKVLQDITSEKSSKKKEKITWRTDSDNQFRQRTTY